MSWERDPKARAETDLTDTKRGREKEKESERL